VGIGLCRKGIIEDGERLLEKAKMATFEIGVVFVYV
jgi:hypothetical protein